MLSFLSVFIGGGLGASSRYVLSRFINKKYVPWGTFLVNVLGCFIFGVFVSLFLVQKLLPNEKMFLLSGFCGGFTTFSTFCSESGNLLEGTKKDVLMWFGYLASSVFCGLFAMYFGLHLFSVFS